MIPIPIFRAADVDARRRRQAHVLEQACSIEYRDITGRDNVLPRHRDCPVVCVSYEAGYWQLQCNDPDLPRETLQEIVARLRKWDGAPAMS